VSPPLLQADGLVKRFGRRRNAVNAVDGVSFELAAGDSLGLVGESGSGKTTVARMLLGLLAPTSGTVSLLGRDIAHGRARSLRSVRREVQMVFQDPTSSLNPRRTVGAIVAEPLAVHGVGERSERRRTAGAALEQVGLSPSDAGRHLHELSVGQRQRVGIARALVLKPRLLVADEPVSALDVSIQAQILAVLREARHALGLSLVLISHDLAVVRHMCDRVAVMREGRIVELDEAQRLFASPREPYTRELLAAIPALQPASGAAASAPPPASSSSSDS
jgi:ABC-type glutathione transport system ATPase component